LHSWWGDVPSMESEGSLLARRARAAPGSSMRQVVRSPEKPQKPGGPHGLDQSPHITVRSQSSEWRNRQGRPYVYPAPSCRRRDTAGFCSLPGRRAFTEIGNFPPSTNAVFIEGGKISQETDRVTTGFRTDDDQTNQGDPTAEHGNGRRWTCWYEQKIEIPTGRCPTRHHNLAPSGWQQYIAGVGCHPLCRFRRMCRRDRVATSKSGNDKDRVQPRKRGTVAVAAVRGQAARRDRKPRLWPEDRGPAWSRPFSGRGTGGSGTPRQWKGCRLA
jgi:hypothetical protein